MKWANVSRARIHIAKHRVTPEEAWEAFLNVRFILRAKEEPRFPPFLRYWSIAETDKGRRLFIVWDRHREKFDLITAFDSSSEKEAQYARETKNKAPIR